MIRQLLQLGKEVPPLKMGATRAKGLDDNAPVPQLQQAVKNLRLGSRNQLHQKYVRTELIFHLKGSRRLFSRPAVLQVYAVRIDFPDIGRGNAFKVRLIFFDFYPLFSSPQITRLLHTTNLKGKMHCLSRQCILKVAAGCHFTDPIAVFYKYFIIVGTRIFISTGFAT